MATGFCNPCSPSGVIGPGREAVVLAEVGHRVLLSIFREGGIRQQLRCPRVWDRLQEQRGACTRTRSGTSFLKVPNQTLCWFLKIVKSAHRKLCCFVATGGRRAGILLRGVICHVGKFLASRLLILFNCKMFHTQVSHFLASTRHDNARSK